MEHCLFVNRYTVLSRLTPQIDMFSDTERPTGNASPRVMADAQHVDLPTAHDGTVVSVSPVLAGLRRTRRGRAMCTHWHACGEGKRARGEPKAPSPKILLTPQSW
eukprot:scaffold39048_cov70-Phaeocystis_antarctica.AAC.2